ncbi:MAG TPA: polysaccharide deacetylase family protein [Elusimicrobiales bacterium]|nr:polysaccharide deacetylase family protein [Elusimicrobiales bacterium]
MLEWLGSALGAAAALGFSARWNWWRSKAYGLPVLMYHKIGTPPHGSKLRSLWVSPENFRKQVSWLLLHGFKTVTFSDLAAHAHSDTPLPEKPVLITFDDGYKNNIQLAFPILSELGAKGNIFLVHDTIGTHNAWHDPESESWVPMLTWDEIRQMLASGVMDFGSHTMTHANLTKVSLDSAAWEMRESKARLEDKLGREMACFAYPYGAGAFVPDIRKRALEAGYLFDFSVRQGIAPWPWDRNSGPLKRLFIRGDDLMLDFSLQLTRGKSRF